MKTKIMLTLACLFCYCMAGYGQDVTSPSTESEDSTVNIVGYFCKNDTVTYWIYENEWKIVDGDTTKTSGFSTKVMLTVTDSTKNGYAMEYKFLDFKSASINNEVSALSSKFVSKLGDKLKNTVIKFHTDEMGHITKYDNLKEIKKQAKQLYADAMKEIPDIDSLKTVGFDIKKITKLVDSEQLVKGYTDELEMLFQWHGSSIEIGEIEEHEDATDDAYESDSYLGVRSDEETGEYSLTSTVDQYIPAQDIKELLGSVYEVFTEEEMADSLKQEFDKVVKDPMTITTVYAAEYFWNGWPKKVITQTNTVYPNLGRGKLRQKYIQWSSISTGNY